MCKTVIYSRQSLDDLKQKNSTDMQKNVCLILAQKKGWLVHEFINEGEKSARITQIKDRPGLMELLHGAETGSISRVITYKRDRLARNVEQYMEILTRLQRAGVEIHFAADNEPPILHGPIGEFLEIILAGLAQQEGENIHRRQMEARENNARKGLNSGGKSPWGYEIKGKKKIPKNGYKDIIEQIYIQFDTFWKWNKSLDTIVQEMKKNSAILSKEKITPTFVKKIIPRTIHKGVIIQNVNGHPYPFYHKDAEIVDEHLWEKVNHKLCQICPELSEHAEKKEHYTALLVNKIHCKECNHFFEKKKVYYTCPICNKQFPIKKFDEHVIEKVLVDLKGMASEKEKLLIELLERKFLSSHQHEKMMIKKRICILEDKIAQAVKIGIGKEKNEDIKHLVKEYKDKNRIYSEVDSRIHHIRQAILEFGPKIRIKEMTAHMLSIEEKISLLAVLKVIKVETLTLNYQYADERMNNIG
jgi:site-specific DNA recombinase